MKHILYTTLILVLSLSSSSDLHSQCFDDGHSPFANQGWLSCNTSIGPIAERGDGHWILYDFGHVYTLDSIYFWNHNVWGETDLGAKSVLIDYSIDKENWITVGPITIEKAPGSWKYTGTQGPSLGNVKAQYAMVTVISTWGEDTACAGLAEVKFGVNNAVDIVEVKPTQEWSVAPNPAVDKILITLPELENINSVSIYNSVGQLIQELDIPNGKELIVPVDEYEEGIYFITIKTASEIITKSFVKV